MALVCECVAPAVRKATLFALDCLVPILIAKNVGHPRERSPFWSENRPRKCFLPAQPHVLTQCIAFPSQQAPRDSSLGFAGPVIQRSSSSVIERYPSTQNLYLAPVFRSYLPARSRIWFR